MTRVWFVLGYLGSGKTTFVKNFLSRHGGRNAVLVNDFGAEDVDGALLAGAAEKVESIFNGSVFCSCRSEQFVGAMLRLSQENFDNILVETSGFPIPFRCARCSVISAAAPQTLLRLRARCALPTRPTWKRSSIRSTP